MTSTIKFDVFWVLFSLLSALAPPNAGMVIYWLALTVFWTAWLVIDVRRAVTNGERGSET